MLCRDSSWNCWIIFTAVIIITFTHFFGVITDAHSSSTWIFQNHLNINLKYISSVYSSFILAATVADFLREAKKMSHPDLPWLLPSSNEVRAHVSCTVHLLLIMTCKNLLFLTLSLILTLYMLVNSVKF